MSTPTPGPAERVQRTAGQVGAVAIGMNLALAFGWVGADRWSEQQTAAVTAAAVFATSVLQNLAGHLRTRSWRHLLRR